MVINNPPGGSINGSAHPTNLREVAREIKLLLTDVDGVLTDGGVYYSSRGEEMKRFSIRDGMGVARLRALAQVEVGIITGERSGAVQMRAEKLNIRELHLGIQDKQAVLEEICERWGIRPYQIAYIGDDSNDLALLQAVGLSAAPADALPFVHESVDFRCTQPGGYGAFREFAEFIITAKSEPVGARQLGDLWVSPANVPIQLPRPNTGEEDV
jgi:3-deoxy-D-manno-octulosonate 8-phosphate phosphatase (KDO 8-P phosphatase)